MSFPRKLKKRALYLSVNVLSMKVLIGTLFFRLQVETGTPFHVVLRATQKSSRLQCKGSIFISQLSQSEFGPVPGIETATTRSAVKRTTD